MNSRQLQRLNHLATLARDAARLRLGSLCRRRAGLTRERAALFGQATKRRPVASPADLRVEALWRRSLLARAADLEAESRAIETEIEAARQRLVTLDGRVSALREVADELRIKARRRAEHRRENDRQAFPARLPGQRGRHLPEPIDPA